MSSTTTAARELAPLLGRLAAARRTGVLTALRRNHKRLFCIIEGQVVLARSNVFEEQFEHVLCRDGLLNEATLATAGAQAKATGVGLATLLIDQGLASRAELDSAMLRHVRTLLDSTLSWEDGEFTFAPGRPNIGDELTIELALPSVVLDHASGLDWPLERLRIKIGPPNATPLIDAGKATCLRAEDRRGAVGYLLEHCNGSADVKTLCEGSPVDFAETMRLLYGLALLGLVEQPHHRGEAPKADTSVTRAECEALLGKEYPDHYAVLGLEKVALGNQIREAYYYLARRYHPDRFRSGPLTDLRERVEVYFTRVTDAYNTLIDEVLRAEYDSQQVERIRADVKPKEDSAYLARTNYARALVLIGKRRFQESVQFLENAVQLDDRQSEYHLELGRVLVNNPRRRAEAEEHLLRSTQLNPAGVPAYLALALLYRKTGRDAEAASTFREVLRWDPEHVVARTELEAMGLKPSAADDDTGGFMRGLFRK